MSLTGPAAPAFWGVERERGARPGDRWIIAGLCVLLVVVTIAMGMLWRYKNAPGEQSDAPGYWPAQSGIERDADRATLVMFAHPMCACTMASLSELRVLMSEFKGRLLAHVLFALPEGVGTDWTTGESWRTAASIPDVRVEPDIDEVESHLFAAQTSGQIVLYDKEGALLFQGGITGARGHVGDNEGRSGITSLLRGRAAGLFASPVFGCALDDADPRTIGP